MRTVGRTGPQESDLTGRARIREAAIESFAAEGFDTSVRTIARHAGVSPGLITHHFGSKDNLRRECDAEVLRRYRELKSEGLADPGGSLLANLVHPDATASLVVYLIRAVLAGGPHAQELMAHLLDSTRGVMADGVRSGLIRPSRDEEARLRYLVQLGMGSLLLEFLLMPGATPEEFVAATRSGSSSQTLPMLELFTEGMLATREPLEEYLRFVASPADDGTGARDEASA